MGQVNKHMSIARRTGLRIPTQEIAVSLIAWLGSLREALQLSIRSPTAPFVRGIHLLHLPYLTTIALVYLNTAGQDVPEVSVAAVLAAACTARIIGDMLLRGSVHALPEDVGWFIAIAITALMHLRPLTSLATHAAADINVLRTALGHMANIWTSSRILAAGLDKILDNYQSSAETEQIEIVNPSAANASFTPSARILQDLCAGDGVAWIDFFPFATAETSPLVAAILNECQNNFPELWPVFDFGEHFDALWDEFAAGQTDFLQDVL